MQPPLTFIYNAEDFIKKVKNEEKYKKLIYIGIIGIIVYFLIKFFRGK